MQITVLTGHVPNYQYIIFQLLFWLFLLSQFVVAGGSPGRMSNFAEFIAKELNHPYKSLDDLKITKSDRFAFYKVGPVLSISVSAYI